MEEQPECVVCLGDLADLPSLSSYDRGTKGFEGRRYKKDIQSAVEAQELLFEEMNRFNARKRRNGKKQYRPRLVMCLGNHEDRITRATNSQAELDGAIGIKDLQYEGFRVGSHPLQEVRHHRRNCLLALFHYWCVWKTNL